MHEEMNHDAGIEGLLGGLRPVAPALGRDELMFRAGQQSVRTKLRSYQAASATLLVAFIAAVGYPLASRSGVTPKSPDAVYVEGSGQLGPLATLRRDESRPRLAASGADEPPSEGSLASLRRAALTGGADALPAPNHASPKVMRVGNWGALAG